MAQGSLTLSILIVNWNVRDLLRACLASVREHLRLPRDEYEVIVVDNASADDSVAMIERDFPWVRLIANQDNVGFGRANNQAMAQASGRYLLLLNPDTLILDDALDQMLSHMESHRDVSALGCKLKNGDGSLQRWTGGRFPSIGTTSCHYLFLNRLLPRFVRPPSLYLDSDVTEPVDVDWVCGACLLLRQSALGGRLFDERFFMYGEDMELCHRLKRNGGRVVYTPLVSIIHYHGASMKKQQGEVLLMSLAGLRAFYASTSGKRGLWLVDLVTIVGFALRYVMYRALAIIRPARGYAERAASSLHYLRIASQLWRREVAT